MIRSLWAFLTGQRVIAIEDRDGDVTWTFAFQTPFGWRAKRYWPWRDMGLVSLLPDGKCSGAFSYTQRWWSAKPLPNLDPGHAE